MFDTSTETATTAQNHQLIPKIQTFKLQKKWKDYERVKEPEPWQKREKNIKKKHWKAYNFGTESPMRSIVSYKNRKGNIDWWGFQRLIGWVDWEPARHLLGCKGHVQYEELCWIQTEPDLRRRVDTYISLSEFMIQKAERQLTGHTADSRLNIVHYQGHCPL